MAEQSLEGVAAALDALAGRVSLVEDGLQAAFAPVNDFYIDPAGKTKLLGGLETFVDTFTSEDSFPNWSLIGAGTGPSSISQIGTPSAGGLVLKEYGKVAKDGHNILLQLVPFQDDGGLGRCIDSIQILDMTCEIGAPATRVGTFSRTRASAEEEALGALFSGYVPKVEGLGVFKELSSLSMVQWFIAAGKEGVAFRGEKETKIVTNTRFWLFARTQGTVFSLSVWLSNPLTAPAGTAPLVQLVLEGSDLEPKGSLVGPIVGTPGDVGIALSGFTPGDVIHSYTAIPLGWR